MTRIEYSLYHLKGRAKGDHCGQPYPSRVPVSSSSSDPPPRPHPHPLPRPPLTPSVSDVNGGLDPKSRWRRRSIQSTHPRGHIGSPTLPPQATSSPAAAGAKCCSSGPPEASGASPRRSTLTRSTRVLATQIDAEEGHSRPRHADHHRCGLLAAGKGSSPSESTSAGLRVGKSNKIYGREKKKEGRKRAREDLEFQNSQQFFTICVLSWKETDPGSESSPSSPSCHTYMKGLQIVICISRRVLKHPSCTSMDLNAIVLSH